MAKGFRILICEHTPNPTSSSLSTGRQEGKLLLILNPTSSSLITGRQEGKLFLILNPNSTSLSTDHQEGEFSYYL